MFCVVISKVKTLFLPAGWWLQMVEFSIKHSLNCQFSNYKKNLNQAQCNEEEFSPKKKKKMNGTDVAWLILIRALNSLVHSEEAKDQCLIKNRSVLAILIAGWWFAIIWSLRSLWNSCLFQKRNQSYIY